MKELTLLGNESSRPLVSPIHVSSVYNFPDLATLDRVMSGAEPGFVYARDGHPNARELADVLKERHKAAWGIVTGSGMGALTAACLACVSAGDRIIASDRLYGRTTKLLRQELARFGIATTFVDTNDAAAVRTAFAAPAKLLLIETISNPLLRVADMPQLAAIAHEFGAKLLVDNTFATPVLCRPIEHGADLVMESLTKLISGHGDVTLGYLCGSDPAFEAILNPIVSTWGLASNPFDCWLSLRGLETIDLRVERAAANASALAQWLSGLPELGRVLYPMLADHPDRNIAIELLPHGAGGMISFELPGGREAVDRFIKTVPGIPFSPSLGHTQTTLSHPDTTSHRYETPEEKRKQEITEGLIRLSVGIEPVDRIAQSIRTGLGIV
jgi:cystathionine beta-lyase/cystathionine gamma-synthase